MLVADGPYIAAGPEAFEGRVIGAGHCVDFVRAAAGAPLTAAWQEGAEVRGNPHIAWGTAIATFESDGSYTSESGNHAAIYLYQDKLGIWVYDQWQGKSVHKRPIRFAGGSGGKRGMEVWALHDEKAVTLFVIRRERGEVAAALTVIAHRRARVVDGRIPGLQRAQRRTERVSP